MIGELELVPIDGRPDQSAGSLRALECVYWDES